MNNLTDIFNLISLLKYIKPQKLIIDMNDERLMKKEFFKNRIYKTITYSKYRNKIINSSIDNIMLIEDSLKNTNNMNG